VRRQVRDLSIKRHNANARRAKQFGRSAEKRTGYFLDATGPTECGRQDKNPPTIDLFSYESCCCSCISIPAILFGQQASLYSQPVGHLSIIKQTTQMRCEFGRVLWVCEDYCMSVILNELGAPRLLTYNTRNSAGQRFQGW
jgi:hypothetical protein